MVLRAIATSNRVSSSFIVINTGVGPKRVLGIWCEWDPWLWPIPLGADIRQLVGGDSRHGRDREHEQFVLVTIPGPIQAIPRQPQQDKLGIVTLCLRDEVDGWNDVIATLPGMWITLFGRRRASVDPHRADNQFAQRQEL